MTLTKLLNLVAKRYLAMAFPTYFNLFWMLCNFPPILFMQGWSSAMVAKAIEQGLWVSVWCVSRYLNYTDFVGCLYIACNQYRIGNHLPFLQNWFS